ncbi:MAG: amidohydrolase family protein, partial [Acidimicrobiales bacterium]
LIGTATGSLWWERDRGLEQLPELIERSAQMGDRYRPGSIKFMVDGVCENGTASMVHPYCGTHDDHGLVFISREMLLEAVPLTMAAGIQPHFHAIGDRAIRDSLDAVAAGNPVDAIAVRPQIAHVQVVDPDDVPRFAQLHVAANAQMLWACNDDTMIDLTAPRLGKDRNRWQFPFRSLIDAGAHFACGSDWSVSTADPFPQMEVAVTRLMPGSNSAFQAEQAITVAEALAGFTTGAAWVNHDEHRSGSITVGKAADLVVVDQDPLLADDLAATKVQMTLVDGRVVSEP